MAGWPGAAAAGAVVLAGVAVLLLRRPPRPGEIWWAEVPYADGTGAKLRPCLVLRRRWRGAVVLKITSRDKRHRRDHVRIPTRGWDPRARRDSWLNLGEPVVVPRRSFHRRAGTADPATLDRVRRRRAPDR